MKGYKDIIRASWVLMAAVVAPLVWAQPAHASTLIPVPAGTYYIALPDNNWKSLDIYSEENTEGWYAQFSEETAGSPYYWLSGPLSEMLMDNDTHELVRNTTAVGVVCAPTMHNCPLGYKQAVWLSGTYYYATKTEPAHIELDVNGTTYDMVLQKSEPTL